MVKKTVGSNGSYLDEFRNKVYDFISYETGINVGLKSFKNDTKMDSLLKPLIYSGSNNSKVVATCGINSNETVHQKGLDRLLDIVSLDQLKVYKNRYSSLSVTINSKETRESRIIELVGSSNGSERFKVEYSRFKSIDVTGLCMYLSKDFVDNGFGVDLFASVWKDVLVDCMLPNKKIEKKDIEPIEKKLNSFGAVIYKGDIGLNSIAGYNYLKNTVEEEVIFPFLHQSELESISRITRRDNPENSRVNAVLFYGPTGNGKTLMAKAISNNSDVNFAYLPLSKIFSKYYSESPKRMAAILEAIDEYSKEKGKTMLFMDELEYLSKRSYDTSTEVEDSRVIDTVLTKLDGILTDSKNLLVVGATNFKDAIDDALLSRFDTQIYFGQPELEDRVELIHYYATQLSVEEAKLLAKSMDGLSCRDISGFAAKAEKYFLFDKIKGLTKEKVPDIEYYTKTLKRYKSDSKAGADGLYS